MSDDLAAFGRAGVFEVDFVGGPHDGRRLPLLAPLPDELKFTAGRPFPGPGRTEAHGSGAWGRLAFDFYKLVRQDGGEGRPWERYEYDRTES